MLIQQGYFHSGVAGAVTEVPGVGDPGLGVVLPEGTQFVLTSGLIALGWQLVLAPVDSNRIARYVWASLKST